MSSPLDGNGVAAGQSLMNNAGTKLVYTRRGGGTDTHWSFGHTLNAGSRAAAVATLLALQSDTGVGR